MLGHSTLIGARTGKVLSYTVRCKSCRVCENAKRRKNNHRKTNVQETGLVCTVVLSLYSPTKKKVFQLCLIGFCHCNPMTFVAWGGFNKDV